VGEATAIVSPKVGRLIWFGPHGGGNLLYVPEGGSLAVAEATLHGGHQFWLGPQTRWTWPPPPAWEAPALTATVDGDVLTLRLPDGAGVPGVTRTYAIEAFGLRCGVRWSDSGRAWHAMHVLQVPRAMRIEPVLVRPTAEIPRGCRFEVEYRGDVLPDGCAFAGERLSLAPATRGAKAFLPCQPLRGTLDGWVLTMLPGEINGRPAGVADLGLNTQVYLGPPERPYLELEQCSDLLLPDADGIASVDMVLSLTAAR
jgi:hypothetical protein